MANFSPTQFTFGRQINDRRNIRLQEEQLKAANQKAATDRWLATIDTHETAANDAIDKQVEIAQEIASQGGGPEAIDAALRFAEMTANQHAEFLAARQAEIVQAGGQGEILNSIPSPNDYLEAKQAVIDGIREITQLTANRPASQSQFFGDVNDAGTGLQIEGARVRSETDNRGNTRFFIGGQEVPQESVTQPVQETREQSPIEGLTATQAGQVIGELTTLGAANNTFARIANEVVRQTQGKPESVGTVGGLLRGLDTLSSQAQGFANVFGIGKTFEGNLDDFNFRELSGESQQVKTRLLDLVFLNLAAKGQTGRAVSDRDLQIFMDATGFGTGSPTRIASGLRSAIEDNAIAFEEQVKIRTRNGMSVNDILPNGLVQFQEPGSSDDLLRQAEEALDRGDLEEATRLLDEAGL